MIMNELAQWAVLIFLCVLVLGLTRQLGHFLLPHREQVLDPAPNVGDTLPGVLTEGRERDRLVELTTAADPGYLALLVLNEQCNGCQHLVEDLERGRVQFHGPLVFVAKESSREFAQRLAGQGDLVIDDPDATKSQSAGFSATPFLLVLDKDLKIMHRDFGGDVFTALQQWELVRADLGVDGPHLELNLIHSTSKDHPPLEARS